MNLILVFVINLLYSNHPMELNRDIESESSDPEDTEPTTSAQTFDEECPDSPDQTTITNVKKGKVSSSKSKRSCIFNLQWLKDPKYATFLRKCHTDKHYAHCFICKSDFSIANGETYLINRHMEQPGHKRLAEIQLKEQ